MILIRERGHRLLSEYYKGKVIVAFTPCLNKRKEFFVEKGVFESAEKILLQSLNNFGCDAHVYLFMPDHCHLLIEGKIENSNTYKCIIDFKQRSGYHLKIKWQKDFYDHVLRSDEDITKQIKYILGNPVRKNLVRNWKEYPLKGSTVYDFNSWD